MPPSQRRHVVKLTANFEHNLRDIQAFLLQAEAPQAFDALLDELAEIVIPNLERFPGMGRRFLARQAHSVEVASAQERLVQQLNAIASGGEIREYVMTHHLLLYAHLPASVVLLSIRHQQQLSFDFQAHWPTAG
ncbi:type II toxin-antitoxin system RelE/ParE family toxin [Xenophilus sp.]|jgi:plasmid stabilization system protein ParE|uniref:type II toxin-antitoxin system RelE/ParE family toxin n=1 Tax=Xenophilus sp. TaxID=1873499 RepID=UPI0037DDCB3F